MSKEEENEREEALAEVMDPTYMTRIMQMMRGEGEGDADADGEADMDAMMNPVAAEVFGADVEVES